MAIVVFARRFLHNTRVVVQASLRGRGISSLSRGTRSISLARCRGLTLPLSSTAARYCPQGERSHEFMSVVSPVFFQMPITGKPWTIVQVAHLVSLWFSLTCSRGGTLTRERRLAQLTAHGFQGIEAPRHSDASPVCNSVG